MKQKHLPKILMASLILLALFMNACTNSSTEVSEVEAIQPEAPAEQSNETAVETEEIEEAEEPEPAGEETVAEEDNRTETEEPEGPQLATASVISTLSNQPGRAIVSARGNHFVVDSVPPLGGPNEEVNPLDMILSALGTCGVFVAERAAIEQGTPLEGVTATVEGDFDPSGVANGETNPQIQAFRVYLDLPGANDEQAAKLVENFTARCPIYTTLSRSAPIDIFTDGEAGSVTTEGLATASVVVQLSNQPGRAIVSARGNHFVIDSVPPLEGPNEERNPLDMILGALATCGTFIYETAAQEQDIPLTALSVTVEGDFDPRGVAGQPVDPRIQAFRVQMQLAGVDAAQADLLQAEFETRCPIFTTLIESAPIVITNNIGQ